MYRLLLIDDDTEVLRIHERYFTGRGFAVSTAPDAGPGTRQLKRQGADCVLLDVMMPEADGFAAFAHIRAETGAPILFLTGRLDETSKVHGLMMGADDYIAKPCGLAELEARVRVNIRRHGKSAQPPQPLRLSLPPLELDIAAHQAYCGDENLMLTGREYDILYLLATNEGNPVTYEQIAVQMWGAFKEDDRRSVMVSVSRLRKKLESHSELRGMLETVWSTGYRLAGRSRHG